MNPVSISKFGGTTLFCRVWHAGISLTKLSVATDTKPSSDGFKPL